MQCQDQCCAHHGLAVDDFGRWSALRRRRGLQTYFDERQFEHGMRLSHRICSCQIEAGSLGIALF